MRTFIVVSEKSWHREVFEFLSAKFANDKWHLIESKEKFTVEILNQLNPDKIFIPHWSYLIPSEIYEHYECIVFHMTDLPYGRGGSPLQNLIIRGHIETKISAIKVSRGLDTGSVYSKRKLTLDGTAKEIFIRSSSIIQDMVEEIITKDLKPQEQSGDVVEFKRRLPEQSNLNSLTTIKEVYDYIRMLDCEGYPHAFIENERFRFEFTNASVETDKEILANVRIIKK